ncbi:predicted protein [Streptomyces viridochromogenes DSM 40736]|uniref:Predicted protein n=1 Tax=Streptomyces viridochromogenes (strain DSM 40736 / JCM 4977 / BCRC 1201 / Tue 494) TaxID=591159 RepID=D9X3Q8_STRVT|nr:predicted protein [Streptomyces viridochromogenes DSM 40736]
MLRPRGGEALRLRTAEHVVLVETELLLDAQFLRRVPPQGVGPRSPPCEAQAGGCPPRARGRARDLLS